MKILVIVLAIFVAMGIIYWSAGSQSGPEIKNPPLVETAELRNITNNDMTFFITSRNPGQGADLGGLAGADQWCQDLAASVGAGDKDWRAYLSANGINARDRIGNGPWKNFKGELIASNVEELHSKNNINKGTALTEKGEIVNGRGDQPNLHDILTGSGMDGRAIPGDADSTCGDWTKSGDGAAMVGHHDRMGLQDDEPSKSWNSSHLSRGCSNDALASSGGGGLIYCFAR
jgi:hypothetical protein